MGSNHLRVHQVFGKEIEEGVTWPRPICRVCRQGHVSWEKPLKARTKQSLDDVEDPDWDPDWITGTIHVIGKCENVGCQQVVIAVGTFRVGYSVDVPGHEHYGDTYSDFYKVEFFSPPLSLLPLPDKVPEAVKEAIDRAAPLLFVDPSFAATALRTSVELFMTSQEIPGRSPDGGHVRLDDRIKEWKKETGHTRVADLFLAVKWIGNEGTHEGQSLTVGDVLDGLSFIESAFHDLYIAPDIDVQVSVVNSNKGRAKAKSSSSDK